MWRACRQGSPTMQGGISLCHGKQKPWFEVNGMIVKPDVQATHLYHERGHDIPTLGREDDETPW